jgi:hypothetical protein
MKSLINSATKEITLYEHYFQIMEEIQSSLVDAKKCRVKVNLAMTKDAFKNINFSRFSKVKFLCCTLDVFVSDMKTLVTINN